MTIQPLNFAKARTTDAWAPFQSPPSTPYLSSTTERVQPEFVTKFDRLKDEIESDDD